SLIRSEVTSEIVNVLTRMNVRTAEIDLKTDRSTKLMKFLAEDLNKGPDFLQRLVRFRFNRSEGQEKGFGALLPKTLGQKCPNSWSRKTKRVQYNPLAPVDPDVGLPPDSRPEAGLVHQSRTLAGSKGGGLRHERRALETETGNPTMKRVSLSKPAPDA